MKIERPRHVVSTRLETGNQGNEALSEAWVDLAGSVWQDEEVVVTKRSPVFARQVDLRGPSALDALGRTAVGLASALRTRGPVPAEVRQVSYRAASLHVRPGPVANVRTAVRRRLTRSGLGRDGYLESRQELVGASTFIVNPAGEMRDASAVPLSGYLLDAGVAAELGAQVAMVNMTFDVEEPRLAATVARGLDCCDLLVWRDERSAEAYRAAGGSGACAVVPDLVITRGFEPAVSPRDRRGLAVAVNGTLAEAAGQMGVTADMLAGLHAAGLEISMVSNEWTTDEPYWSRLLHDTPAHHIDTRVPYRAYQQQLAGYGGLLTSRLHSGVLAMLAGTPTVFFEVGTFKISAQFGDSGVIDVIDTSKPGWEDLAVAAASRVRADGAGVAVEQGAYVKALAEDAWRRAGEALSSLDDA